MMPARSDLATHEVTNQPPPPGDRDLWADDPLLRAFLTGSDARTDQIAPYARSLGTQALRDAARQANDHPPEAVIFDTGGRRLDEVRFHPAYHQLMQLSTEAGYAAIAWEDAPCGHLSHAAMVYLASQVEPGHCCPLTMTYAAAPVLRRMPGLEDWTRAIASRRYDPAIRPVAEKHGATIGMAMTEKQGGSDLRANTTQAQPDGDLWRLSGHKWFCSAPMSDGFLKLAQTAQGLSCFLVPRWLETGRNAIEIQRLKKKLGNRANASAEIEYRGAQAHLLGADGDGVRVILDMVHHTRLDTALAPAGLMRAALTEAHRWASHRRVFQKTLIDQPLMQAVLADLTLDWLGSLALSLHVARSFDGAGPQDRAFARIGVAIAKYLSNKLCPLVVAEAMEALGGIGYIEDGPLPLLYREAPLNGIWEGSGNVICLDVLRSLARAPGAAEMLDQELDAARGLDAGFDRALASYRHDWRAQPAEAEARQFVERTGLLLSAAILIRHAQDGRIDHALPAAFIATRLGGPRGRFAGAAAVPDPARLLALCFAPTA
ncbi:putative acyl-CoA dehydrogenase [Paracoccus isoporae]|uniref:Putative acyl-CoA dehydrogenase n=1 Tax=Paracoccus isoporae TaxID=591205 RepID=A0A1G6YZN5_9RHOB|nr:acyl-CoA dehydrogenase family protein [Paracoccus isoporae]SDD95798.1 putative acyl-CoA dehydrogenase [Paracoccus isoporae]